MIAQTALLHRLAEAAGVALAYRDVFGEQREAPAETVAALLSALGAPAGSDDEARESLRRLQGRAWDRLLPPVAVLRAGRTDLLLSVPESWDALVLRWHLRLEDGVGHAGERRVRDLPATGARDSDGVRKGRRRLDLPPGLPTGYHTLAVEVHDERASATIIVAPAGCHLPAALRRGGAAWGLTTQLYGIRSAQSWGMGDFTDLASLASGAARAGASCLGVNPLHALFPAEPRHISPYSPSSRLFLNELYIDVTAVPEWRESDVGRTTEAEDGFAARLQAARAAALVDHPGVAALKHPALDRLWEVFRDRNLDPDPDRWITDRGAAFRRFQRDGGRTLFTFTVFQALQERAIARGDPFSWRDWSAPWQNPASPEVGAFAAEASDRVEFYQWLQWEADRQLGDAARLGEASGLSIGLYRDLAVGVDGSGGEAWADQELLVPGASVGAPPDLLARQGQNWGLVPLNPLVLRERAYAPFIAALRANMRHAGALRIDHAMALWHLYWIPPGADAVGGGYVRYPFDDLLGVLALESERAACAVIGEDLGTVPEGFSQRTQDANILSYRLLVFERLADGSFKPPAAYEALASASVSTHDLPTLKGYWRGEDIEWRIRLGILAEDARETERAARAHERHLLLDALTREGLMPPEIDGEEEELTPALSVAVHRFLGRAASRLALVQIEDAVGEAEQANLPGTIDEHPNWRRRLSEPLETILADAGFKALAAALSEARAQRTSE